MPGSLADTLLSISLLGAALSVGVVAYSIAFPANRVWPVPAAGGRFDFVRVFLNQATGPVTGVSVALIFALAFIDFGSLDLPIAFHVVAGAGLFAVGGGFGWAGFRTLGPEISTGTPGELEARGPYRVSRNPQYVGAMSVLVGLALLSNSLVVCFAVAPWCFWFLLAPLAEEPWLEALLGDAYTSYAANTRRYL